MNEFDPYHPSPSSPPPSSSSLPLPSHPSHSIEESTSSSSSSSSSSLLPIPPSPSKEVLDPTRPVGGDDTDRKPVDVLQEKRQQSASPSPSESSRAATPSAADDDLPAPTAAGAEGEIRVGPEKVEEEEGESELGEEPRRRRSFPEPPTVRRIPSLSSVVSDCSGSTSSAAGPGILGATGSTKLAPAGDFEPHTTFGGDGEGHREVVTGAGTGADSSSEWQQQQQRKLPQHDTNSEPPATETPTPTPTASSPPRRQSSPLNRAMSNLRLSEKNTSRRLVEYFVVVSAKEGSKKKKGGGRDRDGRNHRGAAGAGGSRRRVVTGEKTDEGGPGDERGDREDSGRRRQDSDSTPIGGNAAAEDEGGGGSGEETKNHHNRGDGGGDDEDDNDSTSPLSAIANAVFHPVITARYPPDDHEDNPLNPMMTHFCHPTCGTDSSKGGAGGASGGGKRRESDYAGPGSVAEALSPRMDYVMPKVHHFVLTNSAGKQMYGTCLTVYEPYDLDTERRGGGDGKKKRRGGGRRRREKKGAGGGVAAAAGSTQRKDGPVGMGGKKEAAAVTVTAKPPPPPPAPSPSLGQVHSLPSPIHANGSSATATSSSYQSPQKKSSNGFLSPKSTPMSREAREKEKKKKKGETIVSYEAQWGFGTSSPALMPRIEVSMTHERSESSLGGGSVGGDSVGNTGAVGGPFTGAIHSPPSDGRKKGIMNGDGGSPSPLRLPFCAEGGGIGAKGEDTTIEREDSPRNVHSSDNSSPDDDDDGENDNDDAPTRIYYLPRCLCILSSWPYLMAFREYLTQLYRLYFSTGGGGGPMVAPLERYIVNLCAEVAAPPPGVFEVRCTIFNSTIKFWAPPANQPIAWVALPFSHLFSCLSPENVLTTWHALTLERQVLLVSSQVSLLTVCSEILISLLFPMTWSNLYIPVVPQFLTPMLDAPMPYLCGMSRNNYQHALLNSDISRECVVVDLDNNEVTLGVETPEMPALPPRRRHKLLKVMNLSVGHVFREARCLAVWDDPNDPATKKAADKAWSERLANFDEAFNLAFTPDSPNLVDGDGGEGGGGGSMKQSQWDKVQEAFLRFYVSVLRDYRKYLIFPSKDDAKAKGAGRGFRTKTFIAISRAEYQPFLQELCATQLFDTFLTKRLYDPGEADVTFFDQSINAKLNRSKLKLKKYDTPFLQAAQAHKKLKTIVAMEPNTQGLPPDWMAAHGKGDGGVSPRIGDKDGDCPNDGKSKSPDGEKKISSARKKRQQVAHPKWPDTLNPKLYSEARSLPLIVDAEFDRQGKISHRLRSKFIQFDKSFFGDCDPSPEVGTFTVFFIAYTAIIGRELVAVLERTRTLRSSLSEDVTMSTATSRRDSFTSSVSSRNLASDFASDNDTDTEQKPGSPSFILAKSLAGASIVQQDHRSQIEELNDGTPSREAPAPGALSSNSIAMHRRFNSSMETTEVEEARAIAKAQLDLAFQVLDVMKERQIQTDLDAYKCLIEACGRCGDSTRAMQLVIMARDQGLAADNVMYTCLMNAFSVKGANNGSSYMDGIDGSIDWNQLRKRTKIGNKLKGKMKTAVHYSAGPKFVNSQSSPSPPKRYRPKSDTTSTATRNLATVNNGSGAQLMQSGGNYFMSELYTVASSLVDNTAKTYRYNPKAYKNKKPHKSSLVTEPVLKQVNLGESLLEFLYPDLSIDTNSETCPQCRRKVSEDDIVNGFKSCDSQSYTTACAHCMRQFVPRFSVLSSAPSFEGSSGIGSPLQCEFLSPWVLRKELRNILDDGDGMQNILNPAWRKDADINATLWWNMIVSFMRFRVPLTFLLQGSFKNRLIAPTPDS